MFPVCMLRSFVYRLYMPISPCPWVLRTLKNNNKKGPNREDHRILQHMFLIPISVVLSFSLAGSWLQVWSDDEFRYQPGDFSFDPDFPNRNASFTCSQGWIIPGRYVHDPLAWLQLSCGNAWSLLDGNCAAFSRIMCSVFLDQDVPRTISAIALTAWMNRLIFSAGIARPVVRARFLAAPNPNVAINQPASLTKLQHRSIEAQRNHYTLGIHMTHTHTRDCCILLHFQKVCAAFSKLVCCTFHQVEQVGPR